jgi:hypothetical protein
MSLDQAIRSPGPELAVLEKILQRNHYDTPEVPRSPA